MILSKQVLMPKSPKRIQAPYSPINARIDDRVDNTPIDPASPEKELLRCILIRSIQDATGNTSIAGERPKYAEPEALNWLFSKSLKADTHFPFLYICDHLNIDPDLILHLVNNAREADEKLSINEQLTIRVPRSKKFR